MPQEELTVKFFMNGNGAALIRNSVDFGRLINSWMADRGLYQAQRERFLKLRYEDYPTVVAEELVNLAQEVSGTSLQPGPFPPKVRKAR